MKLSVALVLGLMVLAPLSANAAVISWSTPAAINSNDDIINPDQVLEALNLETLRPTST